MQTIWFNELRSRKVRQRHAQDAQSEPEASVDGENLAEARVLLDRMEQEIFALPDEQRIVLMLVCVEGLTYREAAEAASIPIGTVMSRIASARLTLMRRLQKADFCRHNDLIRLVSR